MCLNGNEWAKRQAAKAGIEFTALDNGFAAVADVHRLQQICDSLGPAHIDALLRKWLRTLPNPFTDEDQAAGYRYELSLLQSEFSLTQMLDTPVSGRIFFEQVLHDNLEAFEHLAQFAPPWLPDVEGNREEQVQTGLRTQQDYVDVWEG